MGWALHYTTDDYRDSIIDGRMHVAVCMFKHL